MDGFNDMFGQGMDWGSIGRLLATNPEQAAGVLSAQGMPPPPPQVISGVLNNGTQDSPFAVNAPLPPTRPTEFPPDAAPAAPGTATTPTNTTMANLGKALQGVKAPTTPTAQVLPASAPHLPAQGRAQAANPAEGALISALIQAMSKGPTPQATGLGALLSRGR